MRRGSYLVLIATAVAMMFADDARAATVADLVHRYSFSEAAMGDATGTTIIDSVGGANGTVLGAGSSATGTQLDLGPGGSSASQAYVDLPNGIVSSLTDATFEAWYTINTATTWSRIFDFGSTTGGELNAPGGGGEGLDYIFFAPDRAGVIEQQRFGMRNNDAAFGGAAAGTVAGDETLIDPEFIHSLGVQYHVAAVYDADGGVAPGTASMTLYIDGAIPPGAANNPADTTIQLGNLNDVNNWLGRSNWTGDQNFGGNFNEFRIWDQALNANEVAFSFINGEDAADPLAQPQGPTLTIDRDSGTISLENGSPVAFNMLGYTVTSAAGGLDPANWMPITGNYDAASNGGDESFDTEVWDNPTATESQWTEGTTEEIFGGDGGTLTQGSPLAIGLAGAWTKSIYEDVAATANIFGGGTMEQVFINYIGNGGEPFERSDLSFNGSVGPEDWTLFIGNHLMDLSAMTVPEAYQHGDLNGDLANDYGDWLLFRADFIAANGAAAWVALTGAAVPEPHTALLTVLGLAGLACIRRRRGRARKEVVKETSALPCVGVRRSLCLVAAAVFAVWTLGASSAEATLTHRYSFNDGTADDSVGTADGMLMFRAAVPGDYNDDGVANAADYTIYRNNLGAAVTLPNENPAAATPGLVDVEEYTTWKNFYGLTDFTSTIAGGQLILDNRAANAGAATGGPTADHVALPATGAGDSGININTYTNVTFEMWITPAANGSWTRVFDIGGQNTDMTFGGSTIFLTDTGPAGGFGDGWRGAISNVPAADPGFNNEDFVSSPIDAVPGDEVHVVLTLDTVNDEFRLYLEGAQIAQNLNADNVLSALQTTHALLGASLYPADPGYSGSINEFRIYDHVANSSDVAYLFDLGPDADAGDIPQSSSVLNLNVNTTTGVVTMENNSPVDFAINYYDVQSAGGSLDTVNWNSFSDQNLDQVDDGLDPGETWDEAGGSSSTHVAEAFLLGNTSFPASHTETLGQLFGGGAQDLVFRFALTSGALLTGTVSYMAGAGAGAAVPEPSTVALLLVGLTFLAGRKRGRLAA